MQLEWLILLILIFTKVEKLLSLYQLCAGECLRLTQFDMNTLRQHVKFLLRQCAGKRFLCAATPRKMDPCAKYIGQIQHGFHLGFWLPIFAFSQHKCLTELLNFAHKTHTTFISPIWIIESSRLKRARNLPPEVSSRRRVQTTTFICMKKYYRHVLEMEWGAKRPKLGVAISFKNNTTFAQGKKIYER